LIPGTELAERPEDRGMGALLGGFLKALHAPEVARRVRHIAPLDPMQRSDPVRRITVAHQRLDEVADRLDVAPLRRIVEEGQGAPLELDALTHGDLHPRHVLVDERGAVSGVIDWGDCCIGSRAVDLTIATALAPDDREAFFRAYGDVDPRLWRHARLIGVHIGAALLASNPAGFVSKMARRWLDRLTASVHEI
jgi:aminoglycoside phosphotransferase (APT) family kinase protein